MSDQIRTLGLYQPYAELMMHGKIETRWVRRGRKPPFPLGPYLLYATQKDYTLQELSQIAGEKQYRRINGIINGITLAKGAAVCTGDLVKIIYVVPGMDNETFVDCRENMRVRLLGYGTPQKPVGTIREVMVGLIFENVRRIKLFPFKGKQGVGFLSEADRRKIEYV